MPRRRPATDPWDVALDPDQRSTLALWITREVQAAIDARSSQEIEVDYWHSLYEQARTRIGRLAPWPDAADLTSYITPEKVDAMHARIMRTIWSEPVWTVEGWGDAADRAGFVEEFHQWKAEEERLQSVLDKWILCGLIEPRGLIEVFEGSEIPPTQRKEMTIAVQTDPTTQGPVYDETGNPALQQDPAGQFVEAQPDQMAAQTVVDERPRVRTGPQYRVIPYKDSVIMPGHARDKQEIWGYGKRLWKRLFEVELQAEQGLYDKDTVSKLTNAGDKEPDPALQRSRQDVVPQGDRHTAQKEFWEVLLCLDLNLILEMHNRDGLGNAYDGPRWYLCTVQIDNQLLLRIQHDDLARGRYIPMILFPRPDRCTEGFSFVGHKLGTIIEEHTAWRNMAADRASMVVQAPIKRLIGALWDPMEQPFGPKQVIDVRDMREIEAMQIPDLNQAVFEHIQMVERNAERVAGINDVASGQVSNQTRTLGEVNMATEQSFVRMDLIVRRAQEALEDLWQIRHEIWKRTLAEQQDGIEVPDSLMVGLEGRGTPIEQLMPTGKITASLLEGSFRGKPHGSVETADKSKLRNDFVQSIQFLPMLMQAFPMLAPMFQTPEAARAIMRTYIHLFNLGSKQAFLGTFSQSMGTPPPPPPMGMGMGMPGMPPGMSPGMPPGPPGMPPGGPPQGPPQGGPPPGPPGAHPLPPQPQSGGQAGDHIHQLAAMLAARHGAPPAAPGPHRPQ